MPKPTCLLLLCSFTTILAADSDLAKRRKDIQTRWASFENITAGKGQGARENRGAKGHVFDSIAPGETKVLLDTQGAGEIRRMWFTVSARDPHMLRALRLEMFWDGAWTPAVSVPFGDFFGAILGRPVAFESELFSNPEGRSFNCYIPMPFRKGARITLANESSRPVSHLFYDIDFLLMPQPDNDMLYFHASWRREPRTDLDHDFEILPKVRGEGRFLGAHVGVMVDQNNVGWWGEGEVKVYLDGDGNLPTLAGTGAEDYIGTGWGLAAYHNHFQGCLVADSKSGQYGFYRYHIPDPVYFHQDIRMTIQQIGGDRKDRVAALVAKGAPIRPVSVDDKGRLSKLFESSPPRSLAQDSSPADAWANYQRRDDWSAIALYYLDSPENGLGALAPAAERTAGLSETESR